MIPKTNLIGYETKPEIHMIKVEDVERFAHVIGDPNPVFYNQEAAHKSGFLDIPVPPTFIARFVGQFDCMDDLYASIGIDTQRSFVLHMEQEYIYEQPIYVNMQIRSVWRIASIERFPPPDKMAIVVLEQRIANFEGEPLAFGRSSLIFRETKETNDLKKNPSISGTKHTGQMPEAVLPTITKLVSQEIINNYADVSHDHNPIHLDQSVAAVFGLGKTIAHGMLSMAFLGEVASAWLTQSSQNTCITRLKVTFQGMAYSGDTLVCGGICDTQLEHGRHIKLWARNQFDEIVTIGEADISPLPQETPGLTAKINTQKGYNEVSDITLYKVVRNRFGHYALWPLQQEDVSEWHSTEVIGSKQHCMEYIIQTWQVMHHPRIQKYLQQIYDLPQS